jgi:hypothetical protein
LRGPLKLLPLRWGGILRDGEKPDLPKSGQRRMMAAQTIN